jgi:hypothetical protein
VTEQELREVWRAVERFCDSRKGLCRGCPFNVDVHNGQDLCMRIVEVCKPGLIPVEEASP